MSLLKLIESSESILIALLTRLSNPTEVYKCALTCKSLRKRLSSPVLYAHLLTHFFRAPSDVLQLDQSALSPLDPQLEFKELSRRLWPHIGSDRLQHTIINGTVTVQATKRGDEVRMDNVAGLQFLEPLQPLPEAHGRMKYMEFTVEDAELRDSETSRLVVGFALPGLAKESVLGGTKSSFAVDFQNGLLLDGLLVGSPLDPALPRALKKGDVLGIGLCYECHVDELHMECFMATLNGNLLCSKRCVSSANRGFYLPTIYNSHNKIVLSVNRGQCTAFSFNIAKFQLEHAEHDFCRRYLPVGPNLFKESGKNINYWTEETMAEMFAYADHYKPIKEALKDLQADEICRLQLCIQYWTRINYLFHSSIPEHLDDENPETDSQWPDPFYDEAKFNIFLKTHGLPTLPPPRVSDLSIQGLSKRRSFLIRLTRIRSEVQLQIAKIVAQHFSSRPPLQDDLDPLSMRGGMLEAWTKLTLFLHETLNEPPGASEWIDFIRGETLDALLEEGISLADCCPGFIKSETEAPGAEGGMEEGEDSDEEAPYNAQEEVFALEMTAIGAEVMMWASWTASFSQKLERALLLRRAVTETSDPMPPSLHAVEHDHTLYALSKALLDYRGWIGDNGISMAWVLMQFKSWGFSKDSPLNCIPHTSVEAIAALNAFFAHCVSLITEEQWHAVIKDYFVLDESPDHEDLFYLSHVWHLATGAFPDPGEVAQCLLSVIPTHIQQTYSRFQQATVRKEELKLPPPLEEEEEEEGDAPHPPSRPDSVRTPWSMVGALIGFGLLSAAIGASAAIFVSRSMRK